ncbi:hypothetical protein FGO68_gene9414 [Halteria grandinella]|uniref:Uncharacterized protein n=1 Tax=Halteria grandinella TaxID=5974 RepID=A0A8J8NN28_HALGN|nr:hypothetical protein FGO68_gene9414 [Halteria grandinella]
MNSVPDIFHFPQFHNIQSRDTSLNSTGYLQNISAFADSSIYSQRFVRYSERAKRNQFIKQTITSSTSRSPDHTPLKQQQKQIYQTQPASDVFSDKPAFILIGNSNNQLVDSAFKEPQLPSYIQLKLNLMKKSQNRVVKGKKVIEQVINENEHEPLSIIDQSTFRNEYQPSHFKTKSEAVSCFQISALQSQYGQPKVFNTKMFGKYYNRRDSNNPLDGTLSSNNGMPISIRKVPRQQKPMTQPVQKSPLRQRLDNAYNEQIAKSISINPYNNVIHYQSYKPKLLVPIQDINASAPSLPNNFNQTFTKIKDFRLGSQRKQNHQFKQLSLSTRQGRNLFSGGDNCLSIGSIDQDEGMITSQTQGFIQIKLSPRKQLQEPRSRKSSLCRDSNENMMRNTLQISSQRSRLFTRSDVPTALGINEQRTLDANDAF